MFIAYVLANYKRKKRKNPEPPVYIYVDTSILLLDFEISILYTHTRNALVLGGRECRGCGSEGKSEKVFSRCEVSEETVEGEGERQTETAPCHPQVSSELYPYAVELL